MRGLTLDRPATRAEADDGLDRRVHAWLDARLLHDDPRPVAVALSGGGDSLALLHLTAEWARTRRRPVLALTVDHGLTPDSGGWMRFAEQAALSLGVAWKGLIWSGSKPATGLPAAARAARHALIADAAREAGARAVLFGHTADDVVEAAWMRAQGSTLGRLRDWSPSPAWPQGRGLMLGRPLLASGRGELRTWLEGRGLGWIEDPANGDPRFLRSRARAALTSSSARSQAVGSSIDGAGRMMKGVRSGPERWAGVLNLSRHAGARALAAAVVCAGGEGVPPRGRKLASLAERLAEGEDGVFTLAGARLEADGPQLRTMRDAGRVKTAAVLLKPGVPLMWDGRFEVTAHLPGWCVTASQGRLAQLSDADRAALATLPPAARGAVPVLIRDDGGAPVLAVRAADVRCWVADRLARALDETTHEAEGEHAAHGATAFKPLFSA